jgi:hypothetical protein
MFKIILMKKIYITFFLTLVSLIIYGQNYTPVLPQDTVIFNHGTISVDSVRISGRDKIYYHFQTIGYSEPATRECTYRLFPNWTGKLTVVKENEDNLFFNKYNDTILIRPAAAINTTWHLAGLENGSYFEAKVTAKKTQNILGITDSIKVITITKKSAAGQTEPSDFNGKQIILSKNNGFVKAINFLNFPSDTSSYILTGKHKKGIYNISLRDIYNIEPGDEIHTEIVISTIPYYGNRYRERKAYLSRTLNGNESVTFQYALKGIHEYVNWQEDSSSMRIYEDTISETFIFSNFYNEGLHLPPHKVELIKTEDSRYELNHGCIIEGPQQYGRIKKSPSNYITGSPVINDSVVCMSEVIWGGNFRNYFYLEGLGGPYFTEEGDFFPNANYNVPVYYKKGNQTWGTPIDFITATTPARQTIEYSFAPNPFSDQAVLTFDYNPSRSYTLKVMDMLGNVVIEKEVKESSVNLSGAELTKGIYIFRLSGGQEEASGRIVRF